jgi:hypothetical protein
MLHCQLLQQMTLNNGAAAAAAAAVVRAWAENQSRAAVS